MNAIRTLLGLAYAAASLMAGMGVELSTNLIIFTRRKVFFHSMATTLLISNDCWSQVTLKFGGGGGGEQIV